MQTFFSKNIVKFLNFIIYKFIFYIFSKFYWHKKKINGRVQRATLTLVAILEDVTVL